MKGGEKLYSTNEPKLNLNQINGEDIDAVYIMKLYENLALNEPEQIQRYGVRMSVASLRKYISICEENIGNCMWHYFRRRASI
ncbi:hypothetical protein OCUAc17_24470 [Acinetobacter pittii]|uniref:hypothetical protein n=1 Tax=Acinetobacter pittii TaxID=48296 RepID=UPI001CE51768|nr:hypothetical protein [Acinetobacter pittii]BCZ11072.1 hypothetical protein OCUAc17_24470 [Acinetobacter pittii]